ncbi:RNA polymerase III-inhibiting protein maf1 [Saxophila tyrrhenica]|uniref:Repressor of RNA polymerase III transcription MAF1 n=1 Tax=Saxophila tyrrhenica TaxID=1690608 RepID=A0AAV9PB43_9PEZI|nr:RNA polymerase III-inhibiting protein maf1 [Saxophila tyrrhenica]
MKYLPLRDFQPVTNALNFSKPDLHVIGGCDVYTTKAAGQDKKLYKTIENDLESQHESLVRLSASLSPPPRPAASDDGRSDGSDRRHSSVRARSLGPPSIDLSRNSPFGSLSKISARRTFAYMIATLNASHPDYDFSHTLRPSDFHKERSLQKIMLRFDSTMQNLRPSRNSLAPGAYYHVPPSSRLANAAPPFGSSFGSDVWSPRMWAVLDKEMSLRQCEKYSYSPARDPFDGEEGALWSIHYFFFNKQKKRVCYLYLRGLSVLSHSPVNAPTALFGFSRGQRRKASSISVGEGATKRAKYWFGGSSNARGYDGEGEDDDDEMVEDDPDDDEYEVPYMDLDDIRTGLADGYYDPDLGCVDFTMM